MGVTGYARLLYGIPVDLDSDIGEKLADEYGFDFIVTGYDCEDRFIVVDSFKSTWTSPPQALGSKLPEIEEEDLKKLGFLIERLKLRTDISKTTKDHMGEPQWYFVCYGH